MHLKLTSGIGHPATDILAGHLKHEGTFLKAFTEVNRYFIYENQTTV